MGSDEAPIDRFWFHQNIFKAANLERGVSWYVAPSFYYNLKWHIQISPYIFELRLSLPHNMICHTRISNLHLTENSSFGVLAKNIHLRYYAVLLFSGLSEPISQESVDIFNFYFAEKL